MKSIFKILGILGLFLAFNSDISSQQIERDILASSGTSTSPKLEWTMGEIAVSHLESGITLEQGFHHPKLTITAIYEVDHDINIKVYPNPVTSILTIEHDFEKELNYQLIDNQSRNILSGNKLTLKDQINVSNLLPGVYFLKLYGEKRAIKILKIIKT